MERRLQAAASNGAKVLIIRAGDYFGPKAANNWFSQGLVKPGRPVAAIANPGSPGVGHQWAYLPDVAETMVQLLDREAGLDPFALFHMAGALGHGRHQDGGCYPARGRPAKAEDRRVAWPLIRLAAPFVPLFRELAEMRYLWQVPVRLTNERLRATLGAEPHTPLDEAVRMTLIGLGCLVQDEACQPLGGQRRQLAAPAW